MIRPSSPDSPPFDLEKVRTIHMVAIAGTGMGSFAQLLQQSGYEVRGSDQAVWPPMSDILREAGIEFAEGFGPQNLTPRPDLVIIGNVVRRVNPEAVALREMGLPHLSFPEALGAMFLEPRHSVVVAGTHGKTTTTAMVSWLLYSAGRDPSFLIGGMVGGYDAPGGEEDAGADGKGSAPRSGISARLGEGPHFVVEGDEYDTAYFDKGPKLLHYRPKAAILTSVELDHVDIFRDEAHYESAFERFLELIPDDGYLAVCAADTRALEIAAARTKGRVETYAAREGVEADWTAGDLSMGPEGSRFVIRRFREPLAEASMFLGGRHNVENALAAAAVATSLGLSVEEIVRGLATFHGVARRQQVVGEPGGITIIDDFAHHPTAVVETVQAVRQRYPGRRLWAIFEPRSNTARRRLHQERYVRAFDPADLVVVAAPPPHPDAIAADERLDPAAMVREIAARGPATMHLPDSQAIFEHLKSSVVSGDVVLLMSNGSFGGLTGKLLEELSRR